MWSLNSPDESVRAISIEGIRKIALPGQPMVVKALEDRLSNPRWEFRRDAALALSLVASKDDQDTVKKVAGGAAIGAAAAVIAPIGLATGALIGAGIVAYRHVNKKKNQENQK